MLKGFKGVNNTLLKTDVWGLEGLSLVGLSKADGKEITDIDPEEVFVEVELCIAAVFFTGVV